MRMYTSFIAYFLMFALISCGNETNTDSDTDTTFAGDTAGNTDAAVSDADVSAAPKTVVGSFLVKLVPPVPASGTTPETPGYTSVVGKVNNGPTPQLVIWEKTAEEGACVLYTPRVPFCNTPCGGSAACVEDDTCMNYPSSANAGTVTVKGIKTAEGKSEFTMESIANNYQPAVSLAYPAFAEGDAITMNAAGGTVGAFSIQAQGIAPFDLKAESYPLEAGKAIMLEWTAAEKQGVSTVHVKLDISHHGGSKGKIECDSADSGSLVLPAALLDKLSALGVAGFPTVIVTRESAGTVQTSMGTVQLIVYSEDEKAITIPGIISCNESADCPEGQTCRDDLTCGS